MLVDSRAAGVCVKLKFLQYQYARYQSSDKLLAQPARGYEQQQHQEQLYAAAMNSKGHLFWR
jgi:hypothetical protein